MDLNSTIYVAGHRGMVGSAIVRRLRSAGHDHTVTRSRAELDLRRQEQTERFFQEIRPDYVFLAAAKVGGILANNTYKAEFIHDNLAIALNAIDAAHKAGVRKLLNLGSSCIYPRLAPQPMREEDLLGGTLEPTNEPYAIAKIAAIKLCRYYNEQYGTDYISLMPTNLYGENDNFNLETAHVLPTLIRKFELARLLRDRQYDLLRDDLARYSLGFGLDALVRPEQPQTMIDALAKLGITADAVELWGDGSPRREFLHVDDLADASFFLMERYGSRDIGELVNVGTGVDLTIDELARTIRDLAGYAGEIRYNTDKPNGTPRKLLDVSRLESLGWRARISLREGLERTIRWYRESVRNVDRPQEVIE